MIEYDEINGNSAQHQIFHADTALAGIFRLTPEELDYIVNYDIKHRIGLSGEDVETDD